ncbi:MAG: electron transport complex subunit RsxC, partial [Lentisphaeria bacterium]|nr:electron transport complex subunit RsxC [Lentisphaeria bacterium]
MKINKSAALSFRGGIHPSGDGKSLSCRKSVQTPPLLERYFVLLGQNAGKAPEPVVAKGDTVKKYQLIAKASGFVSANLHAPTSGTVNGIVTVPGPMGVPAQAIEIISDGLDEAAEPMSAINWRTAETKELLDRVFECGLVGMGGASFPTHVKLSPPPDKKIDTLIFNGAECEPYLTADHRLMVENPAVILEGAAIVGRILGVENVCIGVELNKCDAIEELMRDASNWGVKIIPLKVQYPQGSEKQLIKAITKREVKSGGLPMDAGCVVQNVGTAKAVYDAVINGRPLIERVVTVTGEVVVSPGNWLLRIGTPVIKAVEFAGGVTDDPGKLILGGPMMGFAQKSFDVPVSKNTSGVLLLSKSVAVNYGSGSCIRCGRCLSACPMHLVPCLLGTAIEGERYDLAAQNHVMDCLE